MRRPTAAIVALLMSWAPAASAQDATTAEWPDPGSEDPGGAKLFEPELLSDDYDADAELDLRIRAQQGAPVYRMSWYGWRNLIGDGAALAIAIATGVLISFHQEASLPVALTGIGTFVLAGPIAHLTKGNWGRAILSFLLRVGAPSILGGALTLTGCEVEGRCDELAAALGILGGVVGVLAAAGVDNGVLARDRVEVLAPAAPVVNITPTGASIGVTARF